MTAAAAPSVSIVLPTHNGRRFLREAIESCLAQCYTDWELIVVDDASSDETPAIIAEYVARDQRISTIRNAENRRLPASLNIGFARARGRYFTWTSDDNSYRPDALARMIAALDADPALGLIYAGATTIDDEGRPIGSEPIAPPEQLAFRNVIGGCFLYRRGVHDALGGYDEGRFLVEDYDFWLRASLSARLMFLDADLYRYRRHGGSLTANRLADVTAAHEACLLAHLPHLPWLTVAGRREAFGQLWSAALGRGDRTAARRIFAVARACGAAAASPTPPPAARPARAGDRRLRALCLIRPDYATRSGGDAVHARALVAALREQGCDMALSGELQPGLAGYDLVHIFNTAGVEAPLAQALWARRCGCPAVLSPIYHWHLTRYRQIAWNWRVDPATEEALVELETAQQRLLVRLVAPIMPSSQPEADALTIDFPEITAPLRVVHHGIDPRFAAGDGAHFCAVYDLPLRGFVLCVGRKEERKNQLAAIVACRELGLPLVLIGHEPEGAAAYLARCRAAADGADPPVRFLPNLDPDIVADAYAAARVHVLPSFFEVAELVSLEAALGGCNIVASINGGMRDYLGEAAWYCDPDSTASVRDAIAAAWVSPLQPELGPALAARFTWERAARATLDVYQEALQMRADDTPDATFPLPDYTDYLEDLNRAQQRLNSERQRSIGELARGLEAERAERQRVEAAFRALERHIGEQTDYVRKLEVALAAHEQGRGRSVLRRFMRR